MSEKGSEKIEITEKRTPASVLQVELQLTQISLTKDSLGQRRETPTENGGSRQEQHN